MDRLSIIGLEAWARVGCTSRERGFPQRIEIDADLFLPLTASGRGDDLASSVDYAAVAARLKTEAEKGDCRLIETLAHRAAKIILGEFNVLRTTVRVRKRALPGIAWAEVAVERSSRIPRRPRRKM